MLKAKTKYPAVITDCGLTTPKEDGEQPQPFIGFDITDETGTVHKMTWYGSLSTEGAMEYATKQLVKIGFQGGDFKDLNAGPSVFNQTMKLTVELEHQGTKNSEGKYIPDPSKKLAIKWINVKGNMQKFTGTMPSQVGLFARIKAELGVKSKPTVTATKTTNDW